MIEIDKLTQYKVMHIIYPKEKNELYKDCNVLVLDVNDMLKLHNELEPFLIKIGVIDKVVIKIE